MVRTGLATCILLAALALAGSSAFALSLTVRGTINLPNCTAIDASGTTIYTATVSDFYVLSAANPSLPSRLGQVPFGSGQITAIAADRGYAFCAAQSAGMTVVDVSDDAHPSIATHFAYASAVRGVDVLNGLAAIATTSNVALLNVQDPAGPALLATYGRQGSWVQFDPAGNRLHVGSTAGAYDLSIVLHVTGTDTTYSLTNHHTYGTGTQSPLAVVDSYLDIASGSNLTTLQADNYTYLGQYQASAVIRAVAGIPTFVFLGVGSGTVTMLDQRRGLPESPASIGIPSQPSGITVLQPSSLHLLAVSHASGVSVLSFDTTASAAEISPALPSEFSLTVYPNPFNSVAQLQWTAPTPGNYDLTVFDALGRQIHRETLFLSGKSRRALDFSSYSAGVYFARLQNPKFSATAKLLYLP